MELIGVIDYQGPNSADKRISSWNIRGCYHRFIKAPENSSQLLRFWSIITTLPDRLRTQQIGVTGTIERGPHNADR
jgi:hypothetical protein